MTNAEGCGIDGAVYALDQSGQYLPMLMCACGWAQRGDDWEDAGRQFDEHLQARLDSTDTDTTYSDGERTRDAQGPNQ